MDLIVDDRIAIEIKATTKVSDGDHKGLRKIAEEQTWQDRLLVSQDPLERRYEDGISLMPWQSFAQRLWAGAYD